MENGKRLKSLLDAGFRCLGDLRWVSSRELRQFRYIGIKTAQQLRDVLRRMNSAVDVPARRKN